MRFASLGSGSSGNAMVVEAGATRLLLDVGFGPREMLRRLARLGLEASDIRAVLITHEHTDHIGGAFSCARRFGWEIWLTHGTLAACQGKRSDEAIHLLDSHARFTIDAIEVQPFPVPHDAREPVQFAFSDGRHRLGVLTDAGHVTPHMVEQLNDCDALVLECNHCPELLARGSYPPALKRRIGGPWGHLDNAASAALLAKVSRTRLRHVIAAHLSAENNRSQLAQQALSAVMGCRPDGIGVATQDEGFDWRVLME
jgi:phosphoribosyl 1,2-cyclic phosphodiesterase